MELTNGQSGIHIGKTTDIMAIYKYFAMLNIGDILSGDNPVFERLEEFAKHHDTKVEHGTAEWRMKK